MGEANGFLRAMVDAPDDDALRLVYADWLDDHGDPDRAELIRLQCGPGCDDPAATRRADDLLRAHRAEWEEPFQAVGAEARFCRGFPYFLEADLRRLAENVALLGLAPEWHLILTRGGDNPDAPQVEACARLGTAPCADRIRGLHFAWAWWAPSELAAVLTPAVARAVRELRFGDVQPRGALETLDLVLRVPGLRLHVLGVWGGDSCEGMGDDGCRVIADAPQLASLRGLELRSNEIGPDGAAALAASPHVRGLTDLDLGGGSYTPNRIGPDGARRLARSDNFGRLESLDLVCNSIGDDGLTALAESPQLPALHSLNVPDNGVTDDGLRALARSSGLPALTWLNVCATLQGGITAAGVRELVGSPRMARLTGLKLAGNRIGDAGAAALAAAPAVGRLREFHVGDCGIGRDGLVRMLESPYLAGAREFALYENPLAADEVRELKARYGDRVR
jgi:uncharacterized protein (TIGR02996 family)